jgi:hypothetical protein
MSKEIRIGSRTTVHGSRVLNLSTVDGRSELQDERWTMDQASALDVFSYNSPLERSGAQRRGVFLSLFLLSGSRILGLSFYFF